MNADEAEILDKKAKRRLYDRKKQKKKHAEMKRLQNLVQDLAERAGQLKYFKQSMLPWKDVAIALGRETADSFDSNRMLRGELFQIENIALEMGRWVALMSSLQVAILPKSHTECWQFTSLPKSDCGRQLGFDWITKHLYHNVSRSIEKCNFPANHNPYFSVEVEMIDDTHLVTHCAQRVENVSLHAAASALHNTVFQYPGYDKVLDATCAGMTYRRYKVPHDNTYYYENTLMREFREDNKYILVVHIISDDERNPNHDIRRDWTQWYVAEAIDAEHTLIREGTTWLGLRRGTQYLSIEESTVTHRNHLANLPDEETKLIKYGQYLREVLWYQQEAEWKEFKDLAISSVPVTDDESTSVISYID